MPRAISQRKDHGLKANVGPTVLQVSPFLEKLFHSFHRTELLDTDPIRFVHRYTAPEDQEVVAFLAALFSYGSVPQIQKAVEALLAPLGAHPRDALLGYRGERLWPGFYYRFHKEGHVMALMQIMSLALQRYGSIEAVFTQGLPAEAGDGGPAWRRTEAALNQGVARIYALFEEIKPPSPLRRGLRFLFNSPSTGSGCKRLLMFLRWMVRKDDVDLGIWKTLRPSELVFPLDTHLARLSFYLGLRSSPENRAPSWRMACEVTEQVARVAPLDPVRFDFALARLGILDLCQRRFERSICESCDLRTVCRYSRAPQP